MLGRILPLSYYIQSVNIHDRKPWLATKNEQRVVVVAQKEEA